MFRQRQQLGCAAASLLVATDTLHKSLRAARTHPLVLCEFTELFIITKQDDQSQHTTRRAKINATGFGPWRSRGCPIGSSWPSRVRSRRRNERLGARTQRAAKAACRAGRAGRVGSVEGCGSLQPTTRGGPARGCGLIASRAGSVEGCGSSQPTTRGGPARGRGLIASRAGSSVEWRSFEPSGSKKTARGCPARGSARAAALARCSAECPQPVAPRPQEACKRAYVSQT